MTSKDFRDRLEEIIDEYKSQTAFANKIGAPQNVVNQWINKGYFPGEQYLTAIRDKLNININWLLTGIGPQYLTPLPEQIAEEEAGYWPRIYPENIAYIADVLKELQAIDKPCFDATKKAIEGILENFAKKAINSIELKKRPRERKAKAV